MLCEPVLYLVVLLTVWQAYLYREDDRAEVWDEMVGEIRARRESNTHMPHLGKGRSDTYARATDERRLPKRA